MDKKIEERLKKRYEEKSSYGFDKFMDENPDLRLSLEEFVKEIPWFETIRNAFTAIGHGINNVVKCKACGQPLKVKDAICGRHWYCSKKCCDNDTAKLEKQRQTCLEKYGSTTPLLNEECRKKTIATCMEKFGNEMFAGSDEYKKKVSSPFGRKEVQEKSKQTKIDKYGEDFGKVIFEERQKDSMIKRNMEKYGVPYVLMNKDKADETHRTMKERYGDEFFWRTDKNNSYKNDIAFERILSWSDFVIPLFTREEYTGYSDNEVYRWKCAKCGNEFEQRIYTTGLGDDRLVPRCERCFPKSTCSIAEKEVVGFIKSIYDGKVEENVQTVFEKRMELDIYIPEKKVAIEFDGLYWHSEENGKGRNYHLNKTDECEKRGIRLIHVFEDEWEKKQEIVKDRIKAILGIWQQRIFARKCVLREIGAKESNDFLEKNHLQGGDTSSIRYGLFYNDELVSVMTFGRPRFSKDYDWELIRFASRLGTSVVGGASKLFVCFRKGHFGSVVSYADRRYSDGRMYEKMGFGLVGRSSPNYWYVKGNLKLSRYACQKHKLPALLGDGFDEGMSEHENMLKNGYEIVYDCGNFVYVKKEDRYGH